MPLLVKKCSCIPMNYKQLYRAVCIVVIRNAVAWCVYALKFGLPVFVVVNFEAMSPSKLPKTNPILPNIYEQPLQRIFLFKECVPPKILSESWMCIGEYVLVNFFHQFPVVVIIILVYQPECYHNNNLSAQTQYTIWMDICVIYPQYECALRSLS